jgi:hypothetical protein
VFQDVKKQSIANKKNRVLKKHVQDAPISRPDAKGEEENKEA